MLCNIWNILLLTFKFSWASVFLFDKSGNYNRHINQNSLLWMTEYSWN